MSAAAKYNELRKIILETPAEVRQATEEAIELCRRPEAGADGPLIVKMLRWWYTANFEADHGPLFGGSDPWQAARSNLRQ